MIQPFVDAMSVSPEGGRALFDGSSGNTSTQATSSSSSSSSGSQSTTAESSAKPVTEQHKVSDVSSLRTPPLVTYSDSTVVFLLASPVTLVAEAYFNYNFFI